MGRVLCGRAPGFRKTDPRRVRITRAARLKYLLDTDTCIYALKGVPSVLAALLSKSRPDVAVSVITEAELRLGAARSSSSVRTARLVENFLRPLMIVEFGSADAHAYARVRAR